MSIQAKAAMSTMPAMPTMSTMLTMLDKPARLRFCICQTQPKLQQILRRQCCLNNGSDINNVSNVNNVNFEISILFFKSLSPNR